MPIANLGKVRGDDGANVYIKYNSVAADAGAVDNFSSGTHRFIGMMTSTSKTKPASGYTWVKFVGDDGTPGTNGLPGTPGANGSNGTNGADGKNCYVMFSTTNSISGATDKWSPGQTWIGFAMSNATTAPTQSTDYNWCKFIHDATDKPEPGSNAYFTAGGAYTELNKKTETIEVFSGSLTIPFAGTAVPLTNYKANPKYYIINLNISGAGDVTAIHSKYAPTYTVFFKNSLNEYVYLYFNQTTDNQLLIHKIRDSDNEAVSVRQVLAVY